MRAYLYKGLFKDHYYLSINTLVRAMNIWKGLVHFSAYYYSILESLN